VNIEAEVQIERYYSALNPYCVFGWKIDSLFIPELLRVDAAIYTQLEQGLAGVFADEKVPFRASGCP
jgi:hypothetical protein